ncbi:MAG: hypothetical protein U1B79_00155 [Candidatus Pacearchaeota archaeon]|nr:hypothetical protein [Nanoarchaeota archaeon]MDZ4226509.1 hypothetical protein [Candidatus Pacearchaeota archaeon]
MKMKITKKQEDELFAINLAIGVIGIFLLSLGIANLLKIGTDDIILFWIIFGVILLIYKIILQRKLKIKWNQ